MTDFLILLLAVFIFFLYFVTNEHIKSNHQEVIEIVKKQTNTGLYNSKARVELFRGFKRAEINRGPDIPGGTKIK